MWFQGEVDIPEVEFNSWKVEKPVVSFTIHFHIVQPSKPGELPGCKGVFLLLHSCSYSNYSIFTVPSRRGKSNRNANFEALPEDWRERLKRKKKTNSM